MLVGIVRNGVPNLLKVEDPLHMVLPLCLVEFRDAAAEFETVRTPSVGPAARQAGGAPSLAGVVRFDARNGLKVENTLHVRLLLVAFANLGCRRISEESRACVDSPYPAPVQEGAPSFLSDEETHALNRQQSETKFSTVTLGICEGPSSPQRRLLAMR